jgi:pimeloyl-ACP methyl ester carboxylesterase
MSSYPRCPDTASPAANGPGWDPDHIARAWAELMKRLGHTRYVAQGGDWGFPITSAMARQAPAGLLGIHINLPATAPPEVVAVLAASGPAPAGLSEKERAAFDALDTFAKNSRAYAVMMGTRPQVIGQALTDSPAGLAAFMYDYNRGEPERLLTKDDSLDNVTLYWLTNSATSSARLYWENAGRNTLTYFNEVDEGGHFAAWEQPDLFAAELRAAFKSLR